MSNKNKELFYKEIVEKIGGTMIYIDPSQPTNRFNPLEIWDEDGREEAVQRTIAGIESFIEAYRSESLTDNERNAIITVFHSKETHTIRSFYNDLVDLKNNGHEGLTSLINLFGKILGN